MPYISSNQNFSRGPSQAKSPTQRAENQQKFGPKKTGSFGQDRALVCISYDFEKAEMLAVMMPTGEDFEQKRRNEFLQSIGQPAASPVGVQADRVDGLQVGVFKISPAKLATARENGNPKYFTHLVDHRMAAMIKPGKGRAIAENAAVTDEIREAMIKGQIVKVPVYHCNRIHSGPSQKNKIICGILTLDGWTEEKGYYDDRGEIDYRGRVVSVQAWQQSAIRFDDRAAMEEFAKELDRHVALKAMAELDAKMAGHPDPEKAFGGALRYGFQGSVIIPGPRPVVAEMGPIYTHVPELRNRDGSIKQKKGLLSGDDFLTEAQGFASYVEAKFGDMGAVVEMCVFKSYVTTQSDFSDTGKVMCTPAAVFSHKSVDEEGSTVTRMGMNCAVLGILSLTDDQQDGYDDDNRPILKPLNLANKFFLKARPEDRAHVRHFILSSGVRPEIPQWMKPVHFDKRKAPVVSEQLEKKASYVQEMAAKRTAGMDAVNPYAEEMEQAKAAPSPAGGNPVPPWETGEAGRMDHTLDDLDSLRDPFA